MCVCASILNPDEREQLSTYVPSLPHWVQFTERGGEMEKEVEVKIQTDEKGEEKRRMNMTWRKNSKTDPHRKRQKHWKINKTQIPYPCKTEKDL